MIRGYLTLLLKLKSRGVYRWNRKEMQGSALTCFKVRLLTILAVARKNKEPHKQSQGKPVSGSHHERKTPE